MQIFVKTITGKCIQIEVSGSDKISELKQKISENTHVSVCAQRLIFAGKELDNDHTLDDYGIEQDNTIHLVTSLKGGKPVILFYPPSEGVHADAPAFNTTTTVSIHKDCNFTTLLPRPTSRTGGDGPNTITWNGVVHNRRTKSKDGSAMMTPAPITVDGRNHAYLFWEFVSKQGIDSEVSTMIGFQSLINNASNAFILKGMDEYEEWCHVMLGTLGLGEREQDDFITFWAKDIYEGGGTVIARVIPEGDLDKCAKLEVKSEVDGSEVKVDIHRVYVTMIVCKSLSGVLEAHSDEFRVWAKGSKSVDIPEELRSSMPMKRDASAMRVVEWGGVVMKA